MWCGKTDCRSVGRCDEREGKGRVEEYHADDLLHRSDRRTDRDRQTVRERAGETLHVLTIAAASGKADGRQPNFPLLFGGFISRFRCRQSIARYRLTSLLSSTSGEALVFSLLLFLSMTSIPFKYNNNIVQ